MPEHNSSIWYCANGWRLCFAKRNMPYVVVFGYNALCCQIIMDNFRNPLRVEKKQKINEKSRMKRAVKGNPMLRSCECLHKKLFIFNKYIIINNEWEWRIKSHRFINWLTILVDTLESYGDQYMNATLYWTWVIIMGFNGKSIRLQLKFDISPFSLRCIISDH